MSLDLHQMLPASQQFTELSQDGAILRSSIHARLNFYSYYYFIFIKSNIVITQWNVLSKFNFR